MIVYAIKYYNRIGMQSIKILQLFHYHERFLGHFILGIGISILHDKLYRWLSHFTKCRTKQSKVFYQNYVKV